MLNKQHPVTYSIKNNNDFTIAIYFSSEDKPKNVHRIIFNEEDSSSSQESDVKSNDKPEGKLYHIYFEYLERLSHVMKTQKYLNIFKNIILFRKLNFLSYG